MRKRFLATLSRSQGRNAWAVIFKHPVRIDPNTGKVGLRVRQGLGTSDEALANQLKDQLNQLLEDESYWNLSAKSSAEMRFHRRVLDIFYHGMEPEQYDFSAIREAIIPLPTSQNSEYRRALLLGTTGAGKTTLLRQLIGADPNTERFPSTSKAKTTVHETEVILDNGPYRAVVTFFPIDEVREHLNECISAAVLAAYREDQDSEILRKLLVHVNQRFRFNYILGNGPKSPISDDDDDDDEDENDLVVDENLNDQVIDMDKTNVLLSECLVTLKTIARNHGDQLKVELGAIDENDQRVVDELFEEELDRRLREDDEFHRISDNLLEDIELRFSLLDEEGTIRRNKQRWPQSWSWQTDDREAFIKAVLRFSGNHSPQFGKLLTPLVNGVRVSGLFIPDWNEGTQPKLVLLDGEGLLHTKSVANISTSLARRMESSDAIILVDNATQPLLSAPVAAMKEMISSGSANKLLLVFTHFDEMTADNLPNPKARKHHVLESAENVLASIGEELGPFAERALRSRLKEACFFVGGIDYLEKAKDSEKRRTIKELQRLLTAIDTIVEKPAPVEAKPIYDRMDLVLKVKNAAEGFHDTWWPRLGLSSKPGVSKEHWKRIWALSKRLGTPGSDDEYDNLKPVADLRNQLRNRLYVFLQNPLYWEPNEPSDDDHKLQVFNELASALSVQILDLATRRVRAERMSEWQTAFYQSGRGSSYLRASIIGQQIYDRAAPVAGEIPSLDNNKFLHEVAAVVENVCIENGARLK
ncbi:MAG: Rab family GTPase [Methylobacter sp.]